MCVCVCVRVFPRVNVILRCCVSRPSCCCVSSLSRQCLSLWMTVLLRFACRTFFATPTKNRHAAGVPAAQTLRSDVMFTCAPIGAPEGVARQLVGVLPATAEALMELLSRQKWEDGEVTEHSPQRNEDGCVDVQKVYFRCGGGRRQSFTSPTSFNGFVGCVAALAPGTTVELLLWHERLGTAPSTPEKGEMNCFRVFFVAGGECLSVCACAAGCMLPVRPQRVDSAVFASDWAFLTRSNCFHCLSPNSSMSHRTLYLV